MPSLIRFLHFQISGQITKHGHIGRFGLKEFCFLFISYFVSHQIQTLQADIIRQFFDLCGCTETTPRWFDDHQHGIDKVNRGTTEMFNARVHIEQ